MNEEINAPQFTNYPNLAAEKLGARAITCSDDFFASMHNLVKPGRGIFIPEKYTDRGKWMDGWESRRKRVAGHDWCIVQLAAPGIIHGFDIDTNHFLGNHPPFASVDACLTDANANTDKLLSKKTRWENIMPRYSLEPGSQHFFEINNRRNYSHVRLNIFPDGGVARLKVFGEIDKDWSHLKNNQVIDLAAALNGGRAVACNDMFFSHMHNINTPGKGVNMGDGWETKRNRTPNNRDWLILKLATEGYIQKVMLDTHHFKGNYPDRFSLEGCYAPHTRDKDIHNYPVDWIPILPELRLHAHQEHTFENEIIISGKFTHVRLNIFPDGGVSRLRLWGTKA